MQVLIHDSIGSRFLVQGQRIGPRGRGHAIETQGTFSEKEFGEVAYLGSCKGERAAQCIGSLFAGGDDGAALGKSFEQVADIRGLYHFQKLIGCIVLQTSDSRGRVVEGDAFSAGKQ